MSWKQFEENAEEMAAFGKSRFGSSVAYLATIRKDGSPRVHPVTPIIGEGHLLLFMEPTSPKGHDLRRDPRYALHNAVEDNDGGGGEFYVMGKATYVESPALREIAAKHGFTPKDHYILFEFSVERAFQNVYENDQPNIKRWQAE